MGDAVETEKKLAISAELKKLSKDSASSLSTMSRVADELFLFMIFAMDDYLLGKVFVADPTMNKMIGNYAEQMETMTALMGKLATAATIRDDNASQFRINLDQFIADNGYDIEEIRKRFD